MYVSLTDDFHFYSKFLYGRNNTCPRVPAHRVCCLQRSKARKSSTGQRWSFEDDRFWFCQETHRQVDKYSSNYFYVVI